VHDAVQLFDAEPAQGLGQGRQLLVVGGVELDHLGHRIELADRAVGDADGPGDVGDDDAGAFVLGDLRHLEGDRGVHRDTGDQDGLSVEKSHEGPFSRS
jgi:hypothetical protein